jgi:alpha-2-macroglobulin
MRRTNMSALLLPSVCLLLALSLALAGCAGPTPTPVPGRVPEEQEARVTRVSPAATSEPTAEPTAVPTAVIAPRLLRIEPDRGAAMVGRAPIVLVFDQPMDKSATEGAFALDPTVAGELSWDDARTLRFTPDEEWTPDRSYSLSMTEEALNAHGMPLTAPVTVHLDTAGYLEVARVQPAHDSGDVAVDSVIRVAFNRPVVPLSVEELRPSMLDPIRVEPMVVGKGRWVNTALYEFVPDEPMEAGARYQVSVDASLTDALGVPLDEAYAWSFTTVLPRVVDVAPEPGARYVAPLPEIVATFDQPVVRADAEARFSVRDESGQPVRCEYAWEDAETLVCVPATPLGRGTSYVALVEAGVPARAGGARTDDARSWQFAIAPLPKLVSSTPRNGETGVPLGDEITLHFSCPMSRTTVAEALSITPTVDVQSYWTESDTQLVLYGGLAPSTVYTLTLPTSMKDAWNVPLGTAETLWFETGPRRPEVSLAVPDRMGVYDAAGPLTIGIRHTNISRLDLGLYRLAERDLVRMGGDDGWIAWDRYEPDRDMLVRRWSVGVDAAKNAYAVTDVSLRPESGASLPAAYYYLEVTTPEVPRRERHLLVVTDVNLVLKTSGSNGLVWATELQSGRPLDRVELVAWDGAGRQIDKATTAASGLAEFDLGPRDPWSSLVVTGDYQGSPCAVMRMWQQGMTAWDFGLRSERPDLDHLLYLSTDRQIYRPGQTVYFKGVLRRDDDALYRLPDGNEPVRVIINDAQGRPVYEENYALNDMGSLAGQFALGEAASLGYYELMARVGEEQFGQTFQVAAYRKPAFEVSIATGQNDYVQGDVLHASGSASYFFGGQVADAPVRWRAQAAPFFFDRYVEDRPYAWHDADRLESRYGEGRPLSDGLTRTDAQGAFAWEMPVDLDELGSSQRLTLEASVTGPDNQEVSARTQVVAHAGQLYVGIAPERYVGASGEEQTFHLVTVDTEGVPLPDRDVELIVYRREWFTVQVESPQGFAYWTNEPRDTAVYTATLTTDGMGRANDSFVPDEGGLYRLVARASDSRGNEVRSATYLWVSSSGYVNWGRENHPRIELVPDRESYRPGDVASILVPLPARGPAQALMTVERGGVLEQRVFTLDGSSDRIRLRIEPEYAPNVFVSVSVAVPATNEAPARLFLGYAELVVSTHQKELDLQVMPASAGPYAPGDGVTYEVRASDWQGSPVDAEVSLALVDRAVEILAGLQAPDIVQAFYRERGLGVETSATLANSVDQYNLDRARGEKGGGGGEGMDTMVRKDMPDTAFWAPQVRTGEDGVAQIEVQLPDSLTTWRMRADAVTASTEVGSDHADVVSTLDLLLQPVTPRFAVVGDAPTLGCLVFNHTSQPVEAVVELEARGLAYDDTPQRVRVPANGQAGVTWEAQVLPTDELLLRFRADAGSLADAVEMTLAVRPPTAPSIAGTSGELPPAGGTRIEIVELPELADTSLGGLRVTVEPSLVAGLQDALAYVREYPYACVEQTVSRFYPELAVARALGERLPEEDVTRAIQQASQALQRLYAEQNLDGGWGWWYGLDSSPVLTAYVLQGLAEARRADMLVAQDVIDRGVRYLEEWLSTRHDLPGIRGDVEASVLLALAEVGAGDVGRTAALYERRDDLTLPAKAELALTMALLLPDQTSRLQTLTNELDAAAILSASGAQWHGEEAGWWRLGTDARTTAMALRALIRLEPDSELVPMAVRWLMASRREGVWATTQENAWAILALAEYAASLPGGDLVDEYTVRLDGQEVCAGAVDTDGAPVRCDAPASDLMPGEPSRLRLAIDGGEATVYYSAYLRAYLPADEVGAVARGIAIERSYAHADAPDRSVRSARVNDMLVVRLTVVAERDLSYLLLEDPLPAGTEPVDTSLATTSMAAPWPTMERVLTSLSDGRDWGWYGNWADHIELRDDRVALFAENLPAGTYEYVYAVRCTMPGSYLALPAEAYEMYFPDVFGRSEGARIVIAE